MSTSSTLKLALELAAKVTGREDLAVLAGEVRELGPISDETAAETARLASTLEDLSQQQSLIQQFNDAKAALTQLELATVLSRDKLAQLRAEQQAGTGDAKALADQERLLASEVKQLERQLVAQAASHTRLHAGLTQSGLDTRNLSQEQQRLQRELAQTVAQTERLGRELSQGSQRANGFQGAIGSLTGRLLTLAGTWFGLQTLTAQLVAMFKTGDQAERLDVQLKAVMGSIAGGAEASAWIQDFAKNTPLQLDEVTQVFVRLKAFGIDPMAGAMQGIVDQAYKLGGGFEEVQGISLALGQAWAKQKLQGEEILQLIERGVPVWQLLEQVTGKNTAELQKLSEAGKLGRDTIAALMNEIAAQSSGAARDNMSLLSGLISNAQDNLAKFYRLVSESGALDWLKGQLATLNAEFEAMAKDGRLQAWAQRLSDGFISLGETLKSLIQTLSEWRTALTVLAQAWVGLKIVGWIGDLRSLYAQFIALPWDTAKGWAVATFSGGHAYLQDSVVEVAGVSPAAYNGEHRVMQVSSTQVWFELDAGDPGASGSGAAMTMKVAPLGWTITHESGDGKVFIIRPTNVSEAGNVSLRIDNTAFSGWTGTSSAYLAKVAMVEDVVDINTYTNIVEARWPATKRYSNGRWDLIGDSQIFYFLPAYALVNYQFIYSFGYLKSVRPGDRYHAVLNWYPTSSASDTGRIWTNGGGAGNSGYGNPYPVFDNTTYKAIARAYHQLFGTTTWWQKGLFGVFGSGLPIPNGPDNGFYLSTDPIMVLESGSHLRGYQPGLVVPYGSPASWDRKNFRDLPALPGKVTRFIMVGYSETQNAAGQRVLMGFDLTGPWR